MATRTSILLKPSSASLTRLQTERVWTQTAYSPTFLKPRMTLNRVSKHVVITIIRVANSSALCSSNSAALASANTAIASKREIRDSFVTERRERGLRKSQTSSNFLNKGGYLSSYRSCFWRSISVTWFPTSRSINCLSWRATLEQTLMQRTESQDQKATSLKMKRMRRC